MSDSRERTEVLGSIAPEPASPPPREATEVGGASVGPLPSNESTVDIIAPMVTASFIGEMQLPVVKPTHYERLGEFARGGLGRIVRARDTRTGRIVALKEILGARQNIAARFMREAMITANLQHPSIVPVYELGKWEDSREPFFAMKLVAGTPFNETLKAAKTFDGRLAHIPVIVAVAEALAYAHQRRIIHRDLKPANVLVGEYGETVVIDWGLAKSVDVTDEQNSGDDSIPDVDAASSGPDWGRGVVDPTRIGAVLGTPAFMAPEQARGESADERSDVYAIGAMLYHLIAGHSPYADLKLGDSKETIKYAASTAPTPLALREPGAPADLLTIAGKAMARDPGQRYPNARELASDLRRFLTGQLVGAHRYDKKTLVLRWLRRHRAAVTVGAILAVLLVVVGAIGIRGVLVERDRVRAESARAERGLATVLYEKGRLAEGAQQWARAALYYAESRVKHDTPAAAWAAALADARAIVPSARYEGHRTWVRAAAVAPDGSRVATVDDAGELRVWSPADGKMVGGTQAAIAPLYAIAWSPDGSELAVAGDAGVIELRGATDLAVRTTLRGHIGRVWSLAYSPDGTTLASSGEDATARLWTRDGTMHELRGHTQRVYSVAFSPDGKRLATGSDDRHVWLWDVASQRGVSRGEHQAGGIRAVAFVDDTTVMTTGWDHEIRLWPATGTPTIWTDSHIVHAAALALGGELLVTGGEFDAVHVWDLATHQLVTSLEAPEPISAVTLSRDGRWLVTAGKSGATAWDARPLARQGSASHSTDVSGLSFAPDGKSFASGSPDRTLRVWDLATATERRRIATRARCGDGVTALADGALAAGCDDNVMRHWDAAGTVRELPVTAWMRFLAATPDGRSLVAGHTGGRAAVIDVPTWTLVTERTLHAHHIYDVDVTPQGELVTASLDDHVRTWTFPGLAPILDVKIGSDDGVLTGELGPGGQVVGAGQDGLISIWDPKRAQWIAQLRVPIAGSVWHVAFSSDGREAYSAHDDGTVRIWNTATWRDPIVVDAREGSTFSLALSPDGGSLVAGYKSGAIAIWDVPTRSLRHRIGGHLRDQGSCADLSTLRFGDVTHAEVVRTACTSAPATYRDELARRSRQRLSPDLDVTWSP